MYPRRGTCSRCGREGPIETVVEQLSEFADLSYSLCPGCAYPGRVVVISAIILGGIALAFALFYQP